MTDGEDNVHLSCLAIAELPRKRPGHFARALSPSLLCRHCRCAAACIRAQRGRIGCQPLA